VKYTLVRPCDNCPFSRTSLLGKATSEQRLAEFAAGSFACHKTATLDEESDEYRPTEDSAHCAGALIYWEKRGKPNQMMRVARRLGLYDPNKLDMTADVK
jgi:hypothetical protein